MVVSLGVPIFRVFTVAFGFKVNWKPLGAANLLSFLPTFSKGKLLKGRICSSRSKFFPLRVDLFQKDFVAR